MRLRERLSRTGEEEVTAMKEIQRSGAPGEKGMLYLCATPIGNLEDITFRVLRILKEADLIAAEDTRNSIRLLNHFGITTPMTSYHEYNKYEKAEDLVQRMLAGKTVACITDAGTPGISDPGEVLVLKALQAGIRVSSLPGPAACITALTMSGLPTRRFCFEAFLPPDKKERAAVLEELKTETRTIVLYEAPHHLAATLRQLEEALGKDRRISLCRELTKLHETLLQTTLSGAADWAEREEPRGEFVLVIAGRDPKELREQGRKAWSGISLTEHMKLYEEQGADRKEAMKSVASDRGISRRDVYRMLLEEDSRTSRQEEEDDRISPQQEIRL